MDDTFPKHIAIIPDGNRRWAREHKLPVFEGHRRGAMAAIKILRHLKKRGVHTGTFWAFSTENWSRSKDEIEGLVRVGQLFYKRILNEAVKEGIHIQHIGRKDRLPKRILAVIDEIEDKTKQFTDYYLNIGVDYGGRDEVVRAIKRINEQNVDVETVTEETFGNYLDTGNQPYPNPDIIIRTSGEQRTSGLMIWQGAYAEYFFLEKYFPDMKEDDIDEILTQYASRQRRFGK